MNGPPGDDERRLSDQLRAASNVEVPGDDNHSVARRTILDVCLDIKRDTTRVLLQADDVERTAQFIELTWVDEIQKAIRGACEFATLERMWAA